MSMKSTHLPSFVNIGGCELEFESVRDAHVRGFSGSGCGISLSCCSFAFPLSCSPCLFIPCTPSLTFSFVLLFLDFFFTGGGGLVESAGLGGSGTSFGRRGTKGV